MSCRSNQKNTAKKPQRIIHAPWTEWEKSGKRALQAACTMLEHGHYNYACYVGQEALELFVKAFLLSHKQNADVKSHATWKLLLKIAQERTNSSLNRKILGKEIKSQVMATLEHISCIFESKMGDVKFKEKLWAKHMSSPDTMLGDEVVYIKSSQKLRSHIIEVTQTVEQSEQPLSAVVEDLIKKITDSESLTALVQQKTLSNFDLSQVDSRVTKKGKESILQLTSSLYAMYWLPTIFIAYSHQQYARYPEVVNNGSGYANEQYTQNVAQFFMERIMSTIDEIKKCLHGEITVLINTKERTSN